MKKMMMLSLIFLITLLSIPAFAAEVSAKKDYILTNQPLSSKTSGDYTVVVHQFISSTGKALDKSINDKNVEMTAKLLAYLGGCGWKNAAGGTQAVHIYVGVADKNKSDPDFKPGNGIYILGLSKKFHTTYFPIANNVDVIEYLDEHF